MPGGKQIPEQRFRELWAAGASLRAIADELGITQDNVSTVRRRLGLPPRYGSFAAATRAKVEPIIDPTPEEIAERSAAVRARWDERTREMRRVTKTPKEYQFPVYRSEDFDFDDETPQE